jgi:hypothetical protein
MELADVAICDDGTIAPHDACLQARQKPSDRIVVARRIRTNPGNCRGTLGDAEAVGQGQTKFFFDSRLQIEVQRRAGDPDQAQRAAVQPG